MFEKLSFVSLLSYDYEYLLNSVKSYYEIADEIIIGLDSNMQTWRGNSFEIEPSFFDRLNEIDINSKITIVKSNFCVTNQPIMNDTYERNFLSKYCSDNHWIIQIDSDEIVLEPQKLRNDILAVRDYDYELCIRWRNIYKSFPEGNLFISPETEEASIGTTSKNAYVCCRGTNKRKKLLDGYLLHNSWGRSEKELYQKLKNWSHTFDFDTDKYFENWKSINLENYKDVKNFHPLTPETWKELKFIPTDNK